MQEMNTENVPESWNTTFHCDETRAIISGMMMLSPPVIRKLTQRFNYVLMPRTRRYQYHSINKQYK